MTEPSRRQIVAGSTGTAITIVAGQAAAGLSFLVLARRLAPQEFGMYAVLYTAGVVLGGALDFGSSQLRTHELARGFTARLVYVVAVAPRHLANTGGSRSNRLLSACCRQQGEPGSNGGADVPGSYLPALVRMVWGGSGAALSGARHVVGRPW